MTASVPDPNAHRIFLTGFMGAGKSTIGNLLATKLGYKFYDTDRMMIKGFGRSISEIFQELGEDTFREAETRVVAELCKRDHVVISTGGGTLVREETMGLALAHGVVVYLKAPVEVLFERVIFSPKDRPILNEPETEQQFRDRYDAREVFYSRAHILVHTHERSREDVIAEIQTGLAGL